MRPLHFHARLSQKLLNCDFPFIGKLAVHGFTDIDGLDHAGNAIMRKRHRKVNRRNQTP
jgi:hypothetical protein